MRSIISFIFLCVLNLYGLESASQLRFDQALDNRQWQIIVGGPKTLTLETGKALLIDNSTSAAIINYKYYCPGIEGSRPEFHNFKTSVAFDWADNQSIIRWGIHDRLTDGLDLEINPASGKARLIEYKNGVDTATSEWVAFSAQEKDKSWKFSLTRLKDKIYASAGSGKDEICIGVWQGTIPKIPDFSLKLTVVSASASPLRVRKWNFQPIARFEGLLNVLPLKTESLDYPGKELFPFGNPESGYVWNQGDKAAIPLEIENPGRCAQSYLLKTEIIDWLDNRLAVAQEHRFDIRHMDKQHFMLPISTNIPYGYYTLKISLHNQQGDLITAPEYIGFAVTCAPPDATRISEQALLGTHWGGFGKSGLKHVRLWDCGAQAFWARLEPEKGKWDFSWLDGFVNKILASGKTPLLVFCGVPKWASTSDKPGYLGPGSLYPPRDIEDWKNYCRRMAEHFRGRVSHYEVWNEPNGNSLGPAGFFFRAGVDEYFKLLKGAFEAVKEVDPEIRILAPSGTGHYFPFLEKLMELGGGNYFDILSIHTYMVPLPPEIGYYFNAEKNYEHRVRRSREIMAQYGFAKSLWNTEVGYHNGLNSYVAGQPITYDMIAAEGNPAYWPNWYRGWPFRPVDPRRATAFLSRFAVLSRVYNVERFYYHHRLDMPDASPFMPLPAASFFNVMMTGSTFDKRLPVQDENSHIYQFSMPDGKYMLAVWKVWPETLRMTREDNASLRGVQTGPLAGLADQQGLNMDTLNSIRIQKNYFKEDSRRMMRLRLPPGTEQVYDLFGNEISVKQPELEIGENPFFIRLSAPVNSLHIKNGSAPQPYGNAFSDRKFEGEFVDSRKLPVYPRTLKELFGNLTSIPLNSAEWINGLEYVPNRWPALGTGQGCRIRIPEVTPPLGRLYFGVRTANNHLTRFQFRYRLTKNGKPLELSPLRSLPHREIMRGKGWILSLGYLLSPVMELSPGDIYEFTAMQGHSHLLEIGIAEKYEIPPVISSAMEREGLSLKLSQQDCNGKLYDCSEGVVMLDRNASLRLRLPDNAPKKGRLLFAMRPDAVFRLKSNGKGIPLSPEEKSRTCQMPKGWSFQYCYWLTPSLNLENTELVLTAFSSKNYIKEIRVLPEN